MGRLIDLSGRRFGRLLVLGISRRNGHKGIYWWCLCDCGEKPEKRGVNLRIGHTTSCGCLHRETIAAMQFKHGLTGSPEWCAWQNMKRRCRDPKNIGYQYYGARGISVCESWKNSFEAFYADMGPRPSDNHSIDRINNEGNYEPDNCRWATTVEQRHNRRPQRRKTHCKRGHEFSGENTRVTKGGGRCCRTCHREYEREKYRRENNVKPENYAVRESFN